MPGESSKPLPPFHSRLWISSSVPRWLQIRSWSPEKRVIGTSSRIAGSSLMDGTEFLALKFEPTCPLHSVQPVLCPTLLMCKASMTSLRRRYGVTLVRSGGQFMPQLGCESLSLMSYML